MSHHRPAVNGWNKQSALSPDSPDPYRGNQPQHGRVATVLVSIVAA